MNRKILYLFITLIAFQVNAQESYLDNKPNSKTEFGFKAMKFDFIPYEYSYLKFNNASKKSLEGNSGIIYPFFLKFNDLSKKYGFEFDILSYNISNSNYDLVSGSRNGFVTNNIEFGYIRRDEFNLNYLYYYNQSNPTILYFGLGLKKIDRLSQDRSSVFSYEEKINSVGIKIPIRSTLDLSENLKLNLAFDPYYTLGNRNYRDERAYNYRGNDGLSYPYIRLLLEDKNTIAQIHGFDFEASLAYSFLNNYKISLGYIYNKSHYSLKNNSDKMFVYDGFGNNVSISNIVNSMKTDLFRSVYLSLSYTF
ncbi:hypothetical protein EHQ82_19230 [Leptospira selangorensis]|uniref:Uncharacterized protein n=1 Tax=Leptospira selangorensis TaxID=2484982 RepID=A0ABY2N0Q3_9LEPT|nr:hypothetical protein [Leptospira selangorensis]TGM13635.1 hypothetical protein EHQ82_19230 [Leptospira selangorensis]